MATQLQEARNQIAELTKLAEAAEAQRIALDQRRKEVTTNLRPAGMNSTIYGFYCRASCVIASPNCYAPDSIQRLVRNEFLHRPWYTRAA